MSLILEALRKSEAERRRGQAPDLLQADPDAPAPHRTALPPWYWIGVALAMLLFAWLVHLATTEPQTAAPAAPAARDAALAERPAATESLPAVTHLVPVSIAAPAPIAAPTVVPAPTTATSAVADGDQPQPLASLSAADRRSLPPLELSMHVWNEDPRQRFAILDGLRVAEGDRVGDAVVAAITRDGVVLDWNGRKLALPLP
jgi:general secretion pathway protein B